MKISVKIREGNRTRKHKYICKGFSSSMGSTTDSHATYWRCHDMAEDEPIIIDAIIKTKDATEEGISYHAIT